ncbi:glycosyltransferase [Flavobacteriales bacterium]|nr:glycosyltransferase [Flavobacteriales bacterium]
MKKVVILAYDFPPFVSVGGLRPYAWFKYFNQFDIYPIVITRQWQNKYGNELDYISEGTSNSNILEEYEYGKIIRTPYKPNLSNRLLLKYGKNKFRIIRKLISGYFEFAQFILPIGPKKKIYYAAENFISNEKIDIVIATGDPFILFNYANRLSKKFNIPWIADYRDPWSQDMSLHNKYLFKKWSHYNEKKNLNNVDSVTTVSQFVADKIASNYTKNQIQIIPNGFDPEIIKRISKITQNSDKLTISYAGTIYNWHPIEIFFNSLDQFIKRNSEVELSLNFYGINNQKEIQDILMKYPDAKSCVQFYRRIPNEELLTKLAESHVLLLFNYYSFMGTKIYDYLGLRRKILFCFTDDENALKLKDKYYNIDEGANANKELQSDLIKESNSGVLVKNADNLKDVLVDLISEFNQTRSIKCESQKIARFSREFRVKELADLIRKTISSQS